MKHIQHILSALCVCAFTASAQVTLEFKQTEKSTVTVQSDVNLKQTLQIAGQEIQTQSIQKFTTESVTGDRAADGTRVTFKNWNGKWAFPGGIEMKFDSAVPDAKASVEQLEPILDLLRTMIKHPTTQVYSKEGSLNKVTIPEAAQLVIQAGAMGKGGDVFVLDMGEPIKILDLALSMIRLHGLTPYVVDSMEEVDKTRGDIAI